MTHHVRLSTILDRTLAAVLPNLVAPGPYSAAVYEDVAIELQTQLHAAGYAIHALDGRCVRVPGDPPGREMTPDERILLGLVTVGDALDEQGQR
jgi:hypothetical protein